MTASPDPAAALAAHIAATGFADLPAATVAATKRDILDTLGCALGGSGAPGIAELLGLFRRWGGAGEAGLLLAGGRLPAPQVAYVHGAMAHALDFDDTLDAGGSIHPGASVLAAALATAELRDAVDGRDFVVAVALGLDVSCRIALAATADRGWHRTSAIGVFGAAVTAGRLLGLTAGQLHHALGIAYSQAAGNRQCIVDGALTKRLQAGQAASSGVLAALLAADGFTGAEGVFAGRYGFFELYQPGGYDLAPLTADLGRAWRGDGLSFKPYPCGRPLHAAIDASIALHRRLGPDAAIAEVSVGAPEAVIAENFAGAAHKRAPRQIVEAQFALPFLISAGLLRGRVGIAEVAAFEDPAVRALAARITGVARPGPLTITARGADGHSEEAVAGVPLGAPENPLAPQDLAAKFRDCTAHALRPIDGDVADRLIEFVSDLDEQPDARAIVRSLA
jgi:2-methylcitrate dehydratase PrpD